MRDALIRPGNRNESFACVRDTEQPPAIPFNFFARSRVAFEVDFHQAAGLVLDLKPVLADVPVAAAVAARTGVMPFANDPGNPYVLSTPDKNGGQTGQTHGHAVGIHRRGYRSDRFADEFFLHPVILPHAPGIVYR